MSDDSIILSVFFFLQNQPLDVVQKCDDIVDLLLRLNFTLMSSFNCVIMCPVSSASNVMEVFLKKGASLTQQGFVYHKQEQNNKQGETSCNIAVELIGRQF